MTTTYVSEGDSATPTRMNDLLNAAAGEIFNVKASAYGAVGDGVTDDTAAVQAAIDAAAATSGDAAGAVVVLPKGVYNISSQLTVPGFVTLRGMGSRTSRIHAAASFPTNTALIRLGEGDGIVHGSRLESLRVDAQAIAGSIGVYTNEAQENSGVFGCVVAGYRDIGIDVASGANHAWFRDLEIFPDETSGASAGIRFTQASGTNYASNVSVVGPAGSPIGNYGILIDRSSVIMTSIHVERHTDGVRFATGGATSGIVSGFGGHSSVTNCVHITGVTSAIILEAILLGGSSVSVLDDVAGLSESGNVGRWVSAGRDFIRNDSTSRVAQRIMLAPGQSAAAQQVLNSDGDVLFEVNAVGEVRLLDSGANVVQFGEISDPTAPNANRTKLYTKDDGAGNTQLAVRFNTGAVRVIDSQATLRNNGTATVANATTSIAVTHGLGVTPDLQDISVTPIEAWGSMTQFWISSPTSTQFTINADQDPTQDVDFAWTASIQ